MAPNRSEMMQSIESIREQISKEEETSLVKETFIPLFDQLEARLECFPESVRDLELENNFKVSLENDLKDLEALSTQIFDEPIVTDDVELHLISWFARENDIYIKLKTEYCIVVMPEKVRHSLIELLHRRNDKVFSFEVDSKDQDLGIEYTFSINGENLYLSFQGTVFRGEENAWYRRFERAMQLQEIIASRNFNKSI